MAGERKGKTYEALVKVALDCLKAKGKITDDIFWNEKATGMTVTPDFTLGPDSDHPNAVLLITHSGSAKESEKKNWRNLGELAESKLRLQSVPRVFSVAFDSVVKDSLKAVGAAAFDGQLIVGDRPYGASLVKWIDSHHNSLPKDGDEKAEAIQDLIDKKDAKLTPLFSALLGDLKGLLGKTNPALDSLWAMERKRTPGKASQAKTTSVRRGLSKLLIFEDLNLALRLYRGQKVNISDVPQYAFDLKLAGKAIARASGTDPEIASSISLLTDVQIRSIMEGFDASKVGAWLTTLRNTSHLEFMGKYVVKEYTALCDAVTLFDRLEILHRNPWALVDHSSVPTNWPPADVWLFTFIVELLKLAAATSNGYGYAQMEAEVAALPGLPRPGDPVYRINLPDWVLRRNKLVLSSVVKRGIARCLSDRLRQITHAKLKVLCNSVSEACTNNILETKLTCYRMFDPLRDLIECSISGFSDVQIRACYAEAGGLAGSVAVMQVGAAKSTIINWQSATDEGKDHKVKELCGRAAALRYSWDSKANTFIQRPGIKKLCLVVDGTWTQSDLDTLALAGWDEIFYPDEMTKLAAAIV